MMPESSKKGELRLFRALKFPLQWKLEKVLFKKPLVDAVMLKHDSKYWIFGLDHTGFGANKNGHLEIWYSNSPLGPFKPHKQNPIYNVEKSYGARNGGHPFLHNGVLYRVGQDCGETYGRRIHIFKVEILNEKEYKEIEVNSGFVESLKGQNAWNGVRHHHLDTQQLSSGQWNAVMDGDRVPSVHSVYHLIIGFASVSVMAALVLLFAVLLGAVKCLIPLDWCLEALGKRSDNFFPWKKSNAFSSKVMRLFIRLNRLPTSFRVWLKSKTWVVLLCNGMKHIYAGNGASEPYSVKGQYSEFTLLTMTYEAQLWNLKMYIKHYSCCSSVKEIIVVWNKGTPPDPSEFDSAVPVRIRLEKLNSLNNRFKMDPQIKGVAGPPGEGSS